MKDLTNQGYSIVQSGGNYPYIIFKKDDIQYCLMIESQGIYTRTNIKHKVNKQNSVNVDAQTYARDSVTAEGQPLGKALLGVNKIEHRNIWKDNFATTLYVQTPNILHISSAASSSSDPKNN